MAHKPIDHSKGTNLWWTVDNKKFLSSGYISEKECYMQISNTNIAELQ